MDKDELEVFARTLRQRGVLAALQLGLRFARRKPSKAAAWQSLRQMREVEPALPVQAGNRDWPNFLAVQQFLNGYGEGGGTTQRFVNLTSHYVDILTDSIPPAGTVARQNAIYTSTGRSHCGVPLDTKVFEGTIELPDPQDGVMYIVSDVVRLANPHRLDICSPGRQRFRAGYKYGCTTLVVNPPHRTEEKE